jgi:hypothetical protein
MAYLVDILSLVTSEVDECLEWFSLASDDGGRKDQVPIVAVFCLILVQATMMKRVRLAIAFPFLVPSVVSFHAHGSDGAHKASIQLHAGSSSRRKSFGEMVGAAFLPAAIIPEFANAADEYPFKVRYDSYDYHDGAMFRLSTRVAFFFHGTSQQETG